jgi:hypothetical protein
MTGVSAESPLRPGDGPPQQGNGVPLLRGVALGEPITGHTNAVLWGVVEGRPVLATGGDDDGTVRLWKVIQDRPVPRLPS